MTDWEIYWNASTGYFNWLMGQITFSDGFNLYGNFFWMLTIVSVVFASLEAVKPWRKSQPVLRNDFWIDAFYMYFNFFIFGIIFHDGASKVVVNYFNEFIAGFGWMNLPSLALSELPQWSRLIIFFIVKDFIEWWTHRMLHSNEFFWRFHKVHHSITQMGFAGHLRYHWMEAIIYKSLQYIPLAMLGADIHDYFVVVTIAVIIGHWNHTNFTLPIGPLKYILNNPEMHIWHHAKEMPKSHPKGINFALSLSIWDYIFGTAVIPHNGRDIDLGFSGIEKYPRNFFKLFISGFKKD